MRKVTSIKTDKKINIISGIVDSAVIRQMSKTEILKRARESRWELMQDIDNKGNGDHVEVRLPNGKSQHIRIEGKLKTVIAKAKNAKDVAKILQSSDFGMTEMGGNGYVKVKSKDVIQVFEPFYYIDEKRYKQFVKNWGPDEFYYKYFLEDHGVKLEIVKSDSDVQYNKKTRAFMVELKVTPV